MYAVLPALGLRHFNQANYRTYFKDYSTVSEDDIIGFMITVDGNSHTWTPEEARDACPGRDRMYFPNNTVAANALIATGDYSMAKAEALELINRLVKTSSSSSSKSSSSSSSSKSSSSSSKTI